MQINYFFKCFAVLFFLNSAVSLYAQPILIDRGVRAEGLWCFPLLSDSTTWLYLSDRGHLAMSDDKKPEFSFIRYVLPTEDSPGNGDNTITKASGGGVLHFLVLYDTDEKKVKAAEATLQEILGNNRIILKGPVIFKEARYALVSSILNEENGRTEKRMMAVGAAPVLQGTRIALSFEIDADRSRLLLESLKMPTPDVSIVFDLTFSGLMDAYKAKMTIDWAEVHKAEKFNAGLKIYYIGAELELEYEKLRKTGAISIVAEGDDEKMQKIVDNAYAKLTDLMFQKEEAQQVPPAEKDALGSLLNAFTSGKYFPFGAHVGYKKKDIQKSGHSVLDFSSKTSTDRHHYVTFNIGDFYKKYGQNEDYIKTVSLFDADFQVRRIAIGVDGSLLPEFDKLINNVTVKLRKQHQNGTVTLKEVNITRPLLDKGSSISLSYGSVGDKDRMEWLNYEYNAQFSFLGGKNWETGWVKHNSAMINVLTPYHRKEVKLDGNMDSLILKNVRAATVKVQYPFFDGVKTVETTVKPGDDFSNRKFDITLPAGQFEYKYSIRWLLKDGTWRTATGETDMDILFIDSIPAK